MTRWISSALCTMAFVAILFCLPIWDIRKAAAATISNTMTGMSEVYMVKRVLQKAPTAVQQVPHKQKVPSKKASTIPVPTSKPVPVPKAEAVEKSDEQPESPAEPDEMSSGDTAATGELSDAGVPGGAAEGAADGSVGGRSSAGVNTGGSPAVVSYKSYVLGRIASKKSYPYKARSKGFEGKVRVRIVINPDGTLAQIELLAPSEHSILNKACIAAIKKAAPFKKMARGMSALTLSFVMDFSLH